MKIKVQKPIIESILINLQPFLEKKDASQITSHIYFETMSEYCIAKATDSEIGLEIKSKNIKIEHPGSFTVNGKKLLDIIRILNETDEIVLELFDHNLNIKQQKSKFKLPTFDPSLYPKFPTVEDKPQMELASQKLIQSFKKISASIDTNNPKFELNGALINIKIDSIDIVGTDTRRLSIASIAQNSDQLLSVIIPKKAILEIQKIFLDNMAIYYDQTNLIITNDNQYFFTRLINGVYPDYNRIIPKNIKHIVVLPKKGMIESIKKITTISQDIQMQIMSDKILFNSLSKENIEAKTELELNTGLIENINLNYNSKYMLDFLAHLDGEIFELQINEPNLPFIVKENQFITIIMPIVV